MSWTQASPGVLNPRGNLCDDTFRERHQEATCIHLVTSRAGICPCRRRPPLAIYRFRFALSYSKRRTTANQLIYPAPNLSTQMTTGRLAALLFASWYAHASPNEA